MSPINRLVAAAAIVLAVGGLSAFVLSNRSGGPGAHPLPSASLAVAVAVAVAIDDRAVTRRRRPSARLAGSTFTSSHYGYRSRIRRRASPRRRRAIGSSPRIG